MVSETIEFVLWYEADVRAAYADKRSCFQRGGITGGNGSGHMQVSDPTAVQALRNIQHIHVLDVPYGPFYGKRPVDDPEKEFYPQDKRWQLTFKLHHPEKWLKVANSLKKYYLSDRNSLRDFFTRRYLKHEAWSKTCEELKISRGMYYAMRADVIRAGELYASACNAASVNVILK